MRHNTPCGCKDIVKFNLSSSLPKYNEIVDVLVPRCHHEKRQDQNHLTRRALKQLFMAGFGRKTVAAVNILAFSKKSLVKLTSFS